MLSLESLGAMLFAGLIYLIAMFTYTVIEKVVGGSNG